MLPALLAICLGGCVTSAGRSDVCPPVVEYSDAFRDQLADEIDTLDDKPATMTFIMDSVVLRDMARACRSP